MTLDQYQLCPCGSGKKIKFCCSREFVSDLDRVKTMIDGKQRLAAVEKIDALLNKYPDRASLLMLKAEAQLQMSEAEAAGATLEKLGQVAPDNPSVAAFKGLFAAMTQYNLGAAIHWLQEAFNLTTQTVTPRVYETIVVVARMLQNAGLHAASRGHLQLALSLSDAKDEMAAQTLMAMNHDRQIPLLIREPLPMQACPPDVTWKIEFESAMRDIFRGRWRVGSTKLAEMSKRVLDAPAILFNQAIVQIWLAENEPAGQALRSYSKISDEPLDKRVQAYAVADIVSPDRETSFVDVVEQIYELEQIDEVMEKCLAKPLLISMPVNRESVPEDDKPMPRAVFDVVDRELPKDPKQPSADEIPNSNGILVLFGKETDQSARLVVQAARTDLDAFQDLLKELIGDQEPKEERIVNRVSWFSANVLGNHRLPNELQGDARRDVQVELRRQAIEQRWIETPSPRYENKSPKEASQEKRFQIPLLAELLTFELLSQDGHWGVDFQALRKQLDLPIRESLNADDVDLERLPVHQFSLLDPKTLNDEQLLTVYRRSYAVMAVYPLRAIALEVISRESLADKIDKVEAYDILSDVAPKTDEALEYLAEARKLATQEGESPAAWMIDELELRLIRGEGDKFVKLLKELQARYMKEPGIMPALVETLSKYGLVTPDGRIMLPASAAPSAMSAEGAAAASGSGGESGGLWTPDSANDDPGESQGESKIWVPD